MKTWLKRKLLKWVDDARELPDVYIGNKLTSCRAVESHQPSADPVLSFKIYNATGGKVVEFHSYDRKTDRSENALYIITDEEDFGTAVKNIAITHRLRTGL